MGIEVGPRWGGLEPLPDRGVDVPVGYIVYLHDLPKEENLITDETVSANPEITERIEKARFLADTAHEATT